MPESRYHIPTGLSAPTLARAIELIEDFEGDSDMMPSALAIALFELFQPERLRDLAWRHIDITTLNREDAALLETCKPVDG